MERKRRRNHRTPWRTIHKRISEVALTASVDPRNTSRECPRCGYVVETQEGQTFRCPGCDLKMDRQKVAAINTRRRYLEIGKRRKTRMQGFPHSDEPEISMRVELWIGITQSGRSPVKPREEGLNKNTKPNETQTPQGSCKALKAYKHGCSKQPFLLCRWESVSL